MRYIMEYYSAMKKKEILTFATTWMELEGIIISERNQREKDKYCRISFICGIEKKTRLIDTENRLVVGRGGREWEMGDQMIKRYKLHILF